MRISDWSSDVCSSDLRDGQRPPAAHRRAVAKREVGPLIALRCDIAVAAIDERDDVGGIIGPAGCVPERVRRSEEHTSELQSLMRISYAVFCLKKKIQ